MTEGLIEYGYWGLLLASFLAATILPLGSEVVFSALIVAGLDVWTCILFATIGNALGGLTCYLIGSLGKIEWVEKYLKIKREKIEKMQIWLQGKGAFMGFFAFVPGVGDLIIVALGFMRSNIWITTLSMTLGKFIRYVALGFGTDAIIGWF
ncbi:MAG: YqaA family protein [Dysgonamonadaceae bacterium]|jgi:membrane protein YqaA with SNARE-associated domain|nr:DedA family protein [Dysgonamonadaceae bacterium]MDD3310014.1 DedA family protein [Dysgonamonadaceae bacterium]MDD3900102.1 DedA family protein [Dysgonamonadaceae bacterium]MDD4399228.1 DedA family protein [Dysgonamonadaceae bacterium]MEA5081673.1 YqaA family protein [Dysgonamonadaceae bacterium]